MKKLFSLKNVLLAVVVILLIIQFVPVNRENPEAKAPLQFSPEVATIMKESCADCHSNNTVWPWYSYVAPASWIITHHVEDGRRHLNFSNWGEYSDRKKIRKLDEITEEIEKGNMPLKPYIPLHSGADLTDQEIEILNAWVKNETAAIQNQSEEAEEDVQEK